MADKLYIFWDKQVGGHSAHSTLDGLVDMFLDFIRYEKGTATENEDDNKLLESFEKGEWTEQEKIEFIESHGYEPELVTEELLKGMGTTLEEVKEFGWS